MCLGWKVMDVGVIVRSGCFVALSCVQSTKPCVHVGPPVQWNTCSATCGVKRCPAKNVQQKEPHSEKKRPVKNDPAK
jgi:hypothetical protein